MKCTYRLVPEFLGELAVVLGELVELDGGVAAGGILEGDGANAGLALVRVEGRQVDSCRGDVCHDGPGQRRVQKRWCVNECA